MVKQKAKKTKKESYIQGVKTEVKKISWAEPKEVLKYTIATVIFIAIVVIFFLLLNLILSGIVGLVA